MFLSPGPCRHLNCIHDKGLRSLFEKGFKYRLPSRIDFTKCRSIVEEALQSYCKRWCKKENVGVHALNDWKNEFLRIIDIRIENFTKHPHLYKQPTSRSLGSLKRKMEKLHSKYVFAPADKAANNVIVICKKYYVEVLKSELIIRVHMYLLICRKTNFFSGISIVSQNQISKLTKLISLHFTGCQNYTKILTNQASYLILVTALLQSCLSI